MKKELSQLDFGGVLKDVHQFENQALRVFNAATTVPSSFSRTELTYNGSGSVVNAKFYEGIFPEITEIRFKADASGSLNNTYFRLYSANDQSKYHVWFNVSGGGTAPVIANSEPIEVPIATNDPAEIVALATQLVLNNKEEFEINRTVNLLRIQNNQNGVATDITDFGTGFEFTVIQQGAEKLIKSLDIPYDGQTKYLFNEQERKFEVESVNASSTVSVVEVVQPLTYEIANVNLTNADTRYSYTFPDDVARFTAKIRNGDGILRIYETNVSTDYLSVSRGSSFSSNEIRTNNLSLFVESSQPSCVLEIIYWLYN